MFFVGLPIKDGDVPVYRLLVYQRVIRLNHHEIQLN